MFKWILLLLFVFGCGGELEIISNSELEDETDLSLYLKKVRAEGNLPNGEDEQMASETHSSSDVSSGSQNLSASRNEGASDGKLPTNEVAQNDLVKPPSRDVSSWAEDLHDEVRGSNKEGKPEDEVAQSDLVNSPNSWGGLVGSFSGQNNQGDIPTLSDPYFEVIGDLKPRVVDILIVLDVSHSTNYLRRNHMKDQFKDFLKELETLDWRLGVIQANTRKKGLLPIAGNSFIENPDFEAAFLEAIHKSKNGSSTERPLAAVNNFFNSSEARSFLREDSDGVAVLIVADNDEERLNFKGEMITSEHVLYNYYERYGYDKALRGYSLTVVDDRCRNDLRRAGSNEGQYAPVVTEFVDRTSGRNRSFNLCSAHYSRVANIIASDFFKDDT